MQLTEGNQIFLTLPSNCGGFVIYISYYCYITSFEQFCDEPLELVCVRYPAEVVLPIGPKVKNAFC